MKTITHCNFAKGFRGGERQTLLLIEALSNFGYPQILVTRKKSDLAIRAKDIKNLRIIKISKPYILYISLLKSSTIIHAHETKAVQFAYIINLIYKIPYIITRRVDNAIKNNFFNKLIYKNAKYTVTLSNAIKYGVLQIQPKAKIRVIPSVFTQHKINQKNIDQLRKRFKDRFIVGNIGELDNNHKGQLYLLKASKELPDIDFIFLGVGKDEKKYKEMSKNQNNVFFEGFVENVGDYISIFDIFVFPSLHEGLGSILIDVMNFKKPIIATKVGGIPDIITNIENGILIKPKSKIEIIQAIKTLKNDLELKKSLAMNGYNFSKRFTKENMAREYLKLY